MRLPICAVLAAACLGAAPAGVRFEPSGRSIPAYDYMEVTARVERPEVRNPFIDAAFTGELRQGSTVLRADGFADAEDGSVYRIRFAPPRTGRWTWTVRYMQGDFERTASGTVTATRARNAGPVRVDPKHPFHFIREGTGEHWFYNGTTAYWLLGFTEDARINAAIDRLSRLGVTRIRCALNGRTKDGGRWKEDQVKADSTFRFALNPWPAARPDDPEDPGLDVTRFNLDFFRRAERMLRHARERDVMVSLIFHLDGADKGVDPFGGKAATGDADEQRYYAYVVARLGAFSNVMWDVTNEWHLFRTEAWTNKMGAFIKDRDPYDRTTTVHGTSRFPFRTSPWVDYVIFQSWDEHGSYDFMLKNRREQVAAGRPMPHVNEEYGYEDHYPYPWGEGRRYPARIAENRRRLAWEMTMAGAYQTTGERANEPGFGGWLTGAGNDNMKLLDLHQHMVRFFKSVDWWRTEPQPDLCKDVLCLAERGRLYIVYSREGGSGTVSLENGNYAVRAFDPRTGAWQDQPQANGTTWTAPAGTPGEDRAFTLVRK